MKTTFQIWWKNWEKLWKKAIIASTLRGSITWLFTSNTRKWVAVHKCLLIFGLFFYLPICLCPILSKYKLSILLYCVWFWQAYVPTQILDVIYWCPLSVSEATTRLGKVFDLKKSNIVCIHVTTGYPRNRSILFRLKWSKTLNMQTLTSVKSSRFFKV